VALHAPFSHFPICTFIQWQGEPGQLLVNSRVIHFATVFFGSSIVVLCLTASAKFYSATGSVRVLSLPDPLLHVNNRTLMILAGLAEASIACHLIRSLSPKRHGSGAVALLWLSSNLLAYRLGRFMLGVNMCPCLGSLTEKLGVDPNLINRVLGALALFWFMGSLLILRCLRPRIAPSYSSPVVALPGERASIAGTVAGQQFVTCADAAKDQDSDYH
jgi:hypothetical protein